VKEFLQQNPDVAEAIEVQVREAAMPGTIMPLEDIEDVEED
jgi:hypothetical protein